VKDKNILDVIGADVLDRLNNVELAIIPFGSVEYHGPHAALGTDSFIAEELGQRMAARLPGILCPLVAYTSCPVSTQPNPGTIHVDSVVMTAYIEAVFRGLFKNDLKGVLALNAHDGNIDTIKAAADRVAFDYPDRFVLLINWWQTLPTQDIEALKLFSQDGGHGHGGPLETSAAWAVSPDSVDLSKGEDIEVDFSTDPRMSILNYGSKKPNWLGYHGRISESSIEKGLTLLNLAEERIVEIIENWIQKEF
jgi:creatinine amidohydrolase